MRILALALAAFVVFVTVSAAVRAQELPTGGDPARGAGLYERRCGACHSLDRNRIGPRHRGVFGRRAGGVADYEYSPALRAATIVWSEATLDQWLTNPEALIPGQRMGFRLRRAEERADVIAFLRSLGE